VFFVDALRYELGHELVEELQTICGKTPKVLNMLVEHKETAKILFLLMHTN
jgi:hypothetical protein